MITNDTTATAIAMREATARRLADQMPIIMPDRPADRSRNGQRTPRSVKHKGLR